MSAVAAVLTFLGQVVVLLSGLAVAVVFLAVAYVIYVIALDAWEGRRIEPQPHPDAEPYECLACGEVARSRSEYSRRPDLVDGPCPNPDCQDGPLLRLRAIAGPTTSTPRMAENQSDTQEEPQP